MRIAVGSVPAFRRSIAFLAAQFGQTLEFDPLACKNVNHSQANAVLRREYREKLEFVKLRIPFRYSISLMRHTRCIAGESRRGHDAFIVKGGPFTTREARRFSVAASSQVK